MGPCRTPADWAEYKKGLVIPDDHPVLQDAALFLYCRLADAVSPKA